MAGTIIFDPDADELSFSTSTELAVNTFLDIDTGFLWLTDGSTITEWDYGTAMTYDWWSGSIRVAFPMNLGAAVVEAESYADLTFKFYADIDGTMTLKHTETVTSDEPFRLPGGFLSHLYQVRLQGTDVVTRVQAAGSILELQGI